MPRPQCIGLRVSRRELTYESRIVDQIARLPYKLAWVSCNVASVLDTALLQWVSEYTVRAYTTADSAVSYLNHARIG